MSIRNLTVPPEVISSLNVPQIVDITDRLPVNPKYTWDKLIGGPRQPEKLTAIALHHDAWPKKNRASKDDIAFAAEIAEDHIESKKNEPDGDGGFPYHLWIRNGRIYQTNDLLTYTYGVANNNPYLIHVCVSGDYFREDTLTDPDRKALIAAIMAVKAAVPSVKRILGHGEIVSTNCPGYDESRIRNDVQGLELQLKSAADPQVIRAKLFKAAQQHSWLFNEYQKNPEANKWMEPGLLKLHDTMQEIGLFFGK